MSPFRRDQEGHIYWVKGMGRNMLAHGSVVRRLPAAYLCLGVLGCVEGGNLAVSAGAPVTAVVRGTITDCGIPLGGAEVVLRVQQDEPEQARPVDAWIGPVTTSSQGKYLIEVGPAFAVPGPASVQLRVTPETGASQEVSGGTVELRIGRPARDTARVNVDLGEERGAC
jgi:hypothetical protein